MKGNNPPNTVVLWGFMVLFGYISLLPFYYMPPLGVKIPFTPVSFSLYKYLPVFIIVLIACFSIRRILSAGLLKVSALSIGIYLFTVSTIVSGAGLAYYRVSLAKAAYYFITGGALFFVVTAFASTGESVKKSFAFIRAIALIVSAYGMLTFVLQKDFLFEQIYAQNRFFPQAVHFSIGRIISSLGHPDFLGSYLAVLSPLFLFQFFSQETPGKRRRAAWLYLLFMLTILFTFSGGAYLAAIIPNTMFISLVRRSADKPLSKLYRVCLFMPLLILTILVVLFTIVIFDKFYNADNRTIISILNTVFGGKVRFTEFFSLTPLTRFESIQVAWEAVLAHPLTGIGIGKISSGTYIPGRISMDNMYLSLIAESGLFGICTFLFLNGIILKRLADCYSRITSQENKLIVLTLFTSLSAFLVDSLYWDTLYQPTIRMLYWILLAFAFAIIAMPPETPPLNESQNFRIVK